MKIKSVRALVGFAIICASTLLACVSAQAQGYSINPTSTPIGDEIWTATNVAWEITSSSTFSLQQITTKFAGDGVNGSDVTAVVFNSLGTLISSGSADVAKTGGPVTFHMTKHNIFDGNSYYVGFENVDGLGVNVTRSAAATSLGYLYYGYAPGDFSYVEVGGSDAKPIFTLSTPEPGSLIGLAFGGLGLFGLAWRARKRLGVGMQTDITV